MEPTAFLNSSGAIVAPYGQSRFAANIFAEPYVERVNIPVVSVDPAALYGDHPENLATLTYSSGAALTFFCDSVQGGADTGGDGSFDHPWRSLHTASRFLSCNACALKAAAEYIQLKVKGTVDYVSGYWRPFGWDAPQSRLILRGWGEKCDLGSDAAYAAGYLFNIRGRGYPSATVAYSGCTLVDVGLDGGVAVDCEVESGATLSCAYNCSGGENINLETSVCYGGTFASPITAVFAYAPTVNMNIATATGGTTRTMLTVGSAAVSAVVSGAIINTGEYYGGDMTSAGSTTLTGVAAGPGAGTLLRDCTITVSAVTRIGGNAYRARAVASAFPVVGWYDNRFGGIISGGTLTAHGVASATGETYASAAATVAGVYHGATAANVQTALIASGAAVITGGSGTESEAEYIYNGSAVCSDVRVRQYSGGVMTSSYHSSGCGAWN